MNHSKMTITVLNTPVIEKKTLWKQERQIVPRYARLTPCCNHLRNFIAIASIVLEICTGQNSNMKINKG